MTISKSNLHKTWSLSAFLKRPLKFEKISHLFWRCFVKTGGRFPQILWPSHIIYDICYFDFKLLFIHHFVFRRQHAEFFFSKIFAKWKQFKITNVILQNSRSFADLFRVVFSYLQFLNLSSSCHHSLFGVSLLAGFRLLALRQFVFDTKYVHRLDYDI